MSPRKHFFFQFYDCHFLWKKTLNLLYKKKKIHIGNFAIFYLQFGLKSVSCDIYANPLVFNPPLTIPVCVLHVLKSKRILCLWRITNVVYCTLIRSVLENFCNIFPPQNLEHFLLKFRKIFCPNSKIFLFTESKWISNKTCPNTINLYKCV